jgi:hypothetical protein
MTNLISSAGARIAASLTAVSASNSTGVALKALSNASTDGSSDSTARALRHAS